MPTSRQKPRAANDPSQIPEFDRAMRTLIRVPKAAVDAAIAKEKASKTPANRRPAARKSR